MTGPIRFAAAWYRRLLRLQPGSVRRRFAGDMTDLFTDLAREQYRARGPLGVAALLARAAGDAVLSAAVAHREAPDGMLRHRPQLSRHLLAQRGRMVWPAECLQVPLVLPLPQLHCLQPQRVGQPPAVGLEGCRLSLPLAEPAAAPVSPLVPLAAGQLPAAAAGLLPAVAAAARVPAAPAEGAAPA